MLVMVRVPLGDAEGVREEPVVRELRRIVKAPFMPPTFRLHADEPKPNADCEQALDRKAFLLI